MLARSLPLCVLALVSAVAALTSPLAARQDDGSLPLPDPNAEPAVPQIQLVGPDFRNATDQTFPTCSIIRLRWMYNKAVADSFNAYITNVGVFPVTTTVTTTTSSESAPISGSSSVFVTSGTNQAAPTIPPFQRRADGDITRQVITSQPAVADPREILWAVQVPAGWYRLIGETTTTDTETIVSQSTAFEIVEGDTACFTVPTTSAGANQPEQTAIVPPPSTGGSSNKTGVIAGAVVGSLVALAAVFGLLFACVFRRKRAHNKASRAAQSPWGSVESQDSRVRGLGGLPPGAPNRLSRNAEAMDGVPDLESDSFEEKTSSGGHSGGFSPEPPVFRQYSQSSQAMMLGPLSTRESRRSTLQSIPTNVTPTNATPASSPYPQSDGHASTETAVASVATTAATLGRSNSVAKKLTRKPVPTYRPDSSPSKRNSEEDIPEADLGAQMISHSQRSDTVLLNAFPFEMEGAKEVHYLIPDPPAPPRR